MPNGAPKNWKFSWIQARRAVGIVAVDAERAIEDLAVADAART